LGKGACEVDHLLGTQTYKQLVQQRVSGGLRVKTDRRTDGSLSNDFKCALEASCGGRERAERTEGILMR